jgi:hypothetical protein
LDSEIQFHNSRFRSATDFALVVKREQYSGLSIELYSSSLKTGMSGQYYRSGELHLDPEALRSEPIDVGIREGIDGDSNFSVLGVLDWLVRAERRGRWKEIALSGLENSTLKFQAEVAENSFHLCSLRCGSSRLR